MIDVVVLLQYFYLPCFYHFATINSGGKYFMQTCIMCFISDDTIVLAGWSS